MYVHTLIVDMLKNIWGQCMAHTYARKYIVMIIITHMQKHLPLDHDLYQLLH